MTFASTISNKAVAGNVRIHTGTFNSDAVLTGDIDTGINYLYSINFGNHKAAPASAASGISYDETVPGACGHAVTIVRTSFASNRFIFRSARR